MLNYRMIIIDKCFKLLMIEIDLIYIIPQIGVRSHINEIVDFKVSLGPRIKVVETNNEYIGRVFENNKYLEAFFLQLSLGFPF